ncbi:MAG: molecular chaperone DnaK [Dehalococcoidia bacterium]|nr:molecular chaperone DnaK [Dehalococcoidia bacterium]
MAMDFNVIRSRLEQERKQLTEELEQRSDSTHLTERRDGSPFGKIEEEANGAADLEKRVALQSRIRDTLVQLEHALQKLDEGTYGLCDSCEQPINPARLEALPLATLCVSCKALREG